MPENENHINRIEDIKRHLYDREDTTTNRPHEGILHPIAHNVPASWKADATTARAHTDPMMRKPPMSPFKKFFIGALVFFLCAIGFASYMFMNGGVSVSNENIDITVLGNAFTKGGESLPLQIEINNRNGAALELADLVIEYPRGASDNAADMVRMPRQTIGTIAKGATKIINTTVTLFGDEKSVRNVKISLEYHPEGSNAIFTKSKDYPVTISSAPLSLVIDAPDKATSDQAISFTVTANLNTTLPQGDTMLQIAYPNNFVFDSALPAPTLGNTVWSLASLTQTNPVSIVVKGRLVGTDGDEQVFHVYAGTTSPVNQGVVDVVYNSLLKTMTITKPFLEARVLVNGQDLPIYTASGGSAVNVQISWANNLPTRITDAQVIVTLSGNVFNKADVNPMEGFYDSANSQIIWDKNTVPDFASVEPGATGSMNFSFRPMSLVGSTSQVKSPQVALDVSIKGRQPADGSTYGEVNNFIKKIVKISSDFQIATNATFSSGPLPPKAEKETKYKVAWTLSNSSNDISGAQAKAVLPIYIKWGGTVPGNNENVTYNETTREVIWSIGSVRSNTGSGSNREAAFIVSLTPSLSQVGSVPQLMKDVYLNGQDVYTGTAVKSTRGPITTLLRNDPSFIPGQERVIQ